MRIRLAAAAIVAASAVTLGTASATGLDITDETVFAVSTHAATVVPSVPEVCSIGGWEMPETGATSTSDRGVLSTLTRVELTGVSSVCDTTAVIHVWFLPYGTAGCSTRAGTIPVSGAAGPDVSATLVSPIVNYDPEQCPNSQFGVTLR